MVDADAAIPAVFGLKRLIEAEHDLGPKTPVADVEQALARNIPAGADALPTHDAL